MTTTLPRTAYAGFWRRFAAYAIDYVIAIAASVVVLLVAAVLGLIEDIGETQLALAVLAGYFLYCTLLESSPRQATLGKQAVGIVVTDRDGVRIGLGRAAARFIAKLLSAVTLFLGYLLIALTARRQGLHDILVGTVVRHDHDPPRVAGWIVACVAAAAAVPLAAATLAVALPSYQAYSIRAQVSEGLALAAPYRAAVDAAWREAPREFADLSAETVGVPPTASGRHVESVEVVSGMIVIHYGAAANEAIAGKSLAIVPALDARDSLDWACGYGTAPGGFDVVFEGHTAYTTVPQEYLPSKCRSVAPP